MTAAKTGSIPGCLCRQRTGRSQNAGRKILAVLLLIQDQATANAHAAEVKELAVALPKDIPHQESVNIMNELLRLASRECYGSLSLEDALKGIQFDAGEYTGSVPLDVDGFEPTPDEPKK